MQRSFVFEADTAPAFWLVETLWTVLASGIQTDNRIGFMEQIMGAGLGPPTHRHPHATEGFYILEGTCIFNVLGTSVKAGPGTLVHLPRLLPHSFSVETAEARVLNFYTPACFEILIMACGRLATERRRPTMPESAPPDDAAQIRMLSDLYGQEAVTALPFLQPSTPEMLQTTSHDTGVGEPVIVTAAEVEPHEASGLEWRRLLDLTQTAGSHEIFEVTGKGDAGSAGIAEPSAQALYVIDGSVDIEIAGDLQTLTSRGFAYLSPEDSARWTPKARSRLLAINLAA